MGQRTYNFDVAMQLKDAGLVAASAAAQVGGANQIIDLGATAALVAKRFEGMLVVDVTAIETDSSNELYTLVLQVSSSATFASDIQNVAEMDLGYTTARLGSAITSLVGRYEIPFITEQADVKREFMRLYTVVAGTVVTGINYTAFVAPLQVN